MRRRLTMSCSVPAAAARPGARGEEAEAARGSCHRASPPSVTPYPPAADWLLLAAAPHSLAFYWSSGENSLRSINRSATPAQPPQQAPPTASSSRGGVAPPGAPFCWPGAMRESADPARTACPPAPRHPRAQPQRLGFRNDPEICLIHRHCPDEPVGAWKEFVFPQKNQDIAGLTVH